MSYLIEMNDSLSALDDGLTAEFNTPTRPVSFIFSQPRAASSLFLQLASSTTSVAYITNLMARFWRAPYIGALLDRDTVTDNFLSNFQSGHVTTGAHEPHEWGWFWRHWLKLEGDEHYCRDPRDIDWDGLLSKLAAVEHAFDGPLIIDNVFPMANFDLIRQRSPRSLVIHIQRNLFYVCNSLVNARLDRHKDLTVFYGNRPRNIDEILSISDPIEQIVAQVYSTEMEIRGTLSRLETESILAVHYDRMIEAPSVVMEDLSRFMRRHRVILEPRSLLPETEFSSRDRPDLINKNYRDRLETAYAAYFGEAPVV